MLSVTLQISHKSQSPAASRIFEILACQRWPNLRLCTDCTVRELHECHSKPCEGLAVAFAGSTVSTEAKAEFDLHFQLP